MTLPFERTNAVNNAREFLWRLLDPKETPRVPRRIRQMARSVLKHFPRNFDVKAVNKCKRCREIFGE